MDGYRHWPAFDKLCDLAEKSRLQVGLRASEQAFAERPGEERRQITAIEVSPMRALFTTHPIFTTPIYDDDLEAASIDLLARVA